MCCIIAVRKGTIPESLLRDAAQSNRDGIGVAWICRDSGFVRWKKGLNLKEAKKAINGLRPPFMVHARFATVGGNGPHLTHPFPIERKPSLKLHGLAEAVFMHNGHIHEWEAAASAAGIKLPNKNPKGWSDSRAIAALVATHGADVLHKYAGNRFAILSVDEGLRMIGPWVKYANSDPNTDIMLSSDPSPVCHYNYSAWQGADCDYGYAYDRDGYRDDPVRNRFGGYQGAPPRSNPFGTYQNDHWWEKNSKGEWCKMRVNPDTLAVEVVSTPRQLEIVTADQTPAAVAKRLAAALKDAKEERDKRAAIVDAKYPRRAWRRPTIDEEDAHERGVSISAMERMSEYLYPDGMNDPEVSER